jgi:hypothetical protein
MRIIVITLIHNDSLHYYTEYLITAEFGLKHLPLTIIFTKYNMIIMIKTLTATTIPIITRIISVTIKMIIIVMSYAHRFDLS